MSIHGQKALKFHNRTDITRQEQAYFRTTAGRSRNQKIVHVPGEGMGLKSASDNKLATDLLLLVPSPSSVVILTSSFLFTVFTFLPKDV